MVLGMKQSGSHPGVPEPRAFSTIFDEDVVAGSEVVSGSGAGSDAGV